MQEVQSASQNFAEHLVAQACAEAAALANPLVEYPSTAVTTDLQEGGGILQSYSAQSYQAPPLP